MSYFFYSGEQSYHTITILNIFSFEFVADYLVFIKDYCMYVCSDDIVSFNKFRIV